MGRYDRWFAEHGIVEWSTALAYLATALIAAGLWLRRQRLVPFERLRLYLCIVLLLALVAFLDELSFGEDFIGYERPVLVGYGVGSVHDLMLPLARAFRSAVGLGRLPAVVILVAAAIAAAGALAWAFRRRLAALGRGVGAAGVRPAWLSLGCALLLGALALVVDSAGPIVVPDGGAYLLAAEELIELAAAATLLAGVLWLWRLQARMAAEPALPAEVPAEASRRPRRACAGSAPAGK